MNNSLVLLAILTLSACAAPHERSESAAQRVSRMIGCYQVAFGNWSGTNTVGRLATYAPPPVFRLDSIFQPEPLGRDSSWRVIPHIFASAFPASWRLRPHDSVQVFWSHGLGGVSLRLVERGDTLRGKAVVGTDLPNIDPPTASVAAYRVRCTGAEDSSASVRGTVVELRSGRPLGGVFVDLTQAREEPLYPTVSFDDGQFWIFRVPAGRYYLHAQRCPYISSNSRVVNVEPGHPAEVRVYVRYDKQCQRARSNAR